MFTVKWTGGYPNLCSGDWIVEHDGKIVTLPEDRVSESMGTFGTYSSWHFEDWDDVWEDYEDGLGFEDWIVTNKNWVDKMFDEHGIKKSEKEYQDLFDSFQANDWRHGSCGGCI